MSSRWLLAGALALAACTEPRQLVLSIDTTVGIPCDIDHIRITAKASGTTTFERSLQGARLPISVTLLDDTPDGNFEVEVSGLKDNDEVMRVSGPLQFGSKKTTKTILLDPKCTADAPPCTPDDATSTGAAGPVTARATCRYGGSSALDIFDHDNACTATGTKHGNVQFDSTHAPVRLMDLESTLASSGFQFYGHPINQIWVAKDGYISFTQDSPDPSGVLMPGSLDRNVAHMGEPPPVQSVMAFWDTLSLSSSGICYDLGGVPGNQVLSLTWSHACFLDCTSDDLNFSITLEERTQRVVLTYGTMTAGNEDRARGATATAGLVHDAIGCPADECQLATGLCKDGVTPCGYSQVFSEAVQMPKDPNMQVPNMQFVPIANP